MGFRLPRKRRRVVWLVVALVVLAAGGTGGWLLLAPAEEPAAEPVTATATVDTQRETVAATGTVEPAAQADLTFAVSGEVTDVRVAEGDQVTAGQVLAVIDDELLAAEVTAAESEVDAAAARLADETAAGAADTQLAAANAQVTAAQSRLTTARDALEDAELTATIAGTVVAVELAVGDQVGGGADTGSDTGDQPQQDDSTGAITVVSTNKYQVSAKVAGADLRRIKAGMAVEVTTADATEPVPGTVTTAGLVAQADESGAVTFPVTIAVTGEQQDLYAGSSATVTIVVAERADVLTVPTSAVREDGDTTYVDKIVAGKPVRTEVELGTTYGPLTEITSGLAEGDQVELPAFIRRPGGGDSGPGGGDVIRIPSGGGGPAPVGPGVVQGGGR
ncbi:efflux RND transporter periplasmic adaptor subunit [Actinophytocola sediminis]